MSLREELHRAHVARQQAWWPRRVRAPKPKPTPEAAPARPLVVTRLNLPPIRADNDGQSATMAEIMRAVCEHYGVTRLDLRGSRRFLTVTLASQVTCYLAKQLTPHSLNFIARHVNRDHSTALHAIRRIGARIKQDPDLAAEVAFIEATVLNGRAPPVPVGVE